MNASSVHHFHIPVLGLCYSIDTPLKVARYGISSVLSIVEDELLEDMRAFHSLENQVDFTPITTKEPDYRAKRITAYLNLLHDLVETQAANMMAMPFIADSDLSKYFELLPPDAEQKKNYLEMMAMEEGTAKEQIQLLLKESMVTGAIDVNIMAKVDNAAYSKTGEKLPDEFSDALSALRGFARSKLRSSVVFSAGYNPKLFAYAEQFEDFFPGENDELKKKIILKVSDYRSALVQGKLLAKKGLWVSEFRIESGLNCGGHAFPTEGLLLGPILEEFKLNRQSLAEELFTMCNEALLAKGKISFNKLPLQKISAQGGVCTAEEQQFLLQYFQLDSIGWGSPFLLVPEATNVDERTVQQLATATPEDYFLSNASPLGVPFNNFRKSSGEAQRKARIAEQKAGSPCYKNYLASNTEFTALPICTASKQYQQLKANQIRQELPADAAATALQLLQEKDCLCEGLTASARLKNGLRLSHKLSAVTICPGPNLAWFSGIFSLKEMVDHIYGRICITNALYRPHMFINELKMYVAYLKEEIVKAASATEKQLRYFQKFRTNLLSGIAFYRQLLSSLNYSHTLEELSYFEKQLMALEV